MTPLTLLRRPCLFPLVFQKAQWNLTLPALCTVCNEESSTLNRKTQEVILVTASLINGVGHCWHGDTQWLLLLTSVIERYLNDKTTVGKRESRTDVTQ